MTLQEEFDNTSRCVNKTVSRDLGNTIKRIDCAVYRRRMQLLREHRIIMRVVIQHVHGVIAQVVADYTVDFAFRRMSRGPKLLYIADGSTLIDNIGYVDMYDGGPKTSLEISETLLIMYVRRGRLPAPFCDWHVWHECPADCAAGAAFTPYRVLLSRHIAALAG